MKKLLLATALTSLTTAAQAVPLINLDIGAGMWQPDYGGDLGSTETSVEELGLEDESGNVYYATLEFPIPLIPALKVKRTELETSGEGTLSESFTFAGQDFDVNSDVATDLDLSHNDLTIYWGLPKFYLDVDFGVTLRQFDGSVTVDGEFDTQEEDFDVIIPMLFADVRLDLPLTGLYGRVEGHVLSIDDNSLTDITAAIGYNSDAIPLIADIEFEAGYRMMELTIDDNDLDFAANIDVSGPYLGVQLAF